MKQTNEKSIMSKVAYGVATVGVAVGLLGGIGYINVSKDKKVAEQALLDNAVIVESLQSQLSDNSITLESFKAQITNLGVELSDLSVRSEADAAVIDAYAKEVAELKAIEEVPATEAPVEVVFNGYDEELDSIESFSFVELNDNQVEKLADLEVEFDGEDVDVKEFLTVKGDFELEKEVAFNFVDEDIVYELEFDSGLDFTKDDLKISVLGEEMEIKSYDTDLMVVNRAPEKIAKEGDVIKGLTIVQIGEDAIIVSYDGETEIVSTSKTIGDLEVSVEDIFYSDVAERSLVNLRVGEDLDETIEVDDYVDEDELYQYTTIDIAAGKIVIKLVEDVDEVQELVLPNDFAKVSYALSSEDYNDVSVVKKDDKLSEIKADFEEFDATKVKFEDGNWTIEDNDGDDLIVTGMNLELKDSDYTIDFTDDTQVYVADIEFTPSSINNGVGDEDEIYTTSAGIVIADRDSWNEDDDETVKLSVPEKAVKAKIFVE